VHRPHGLVGAAEDAVRQRADLLDHRAAPTPPPGRAPGRRGPRPAPSPRRPRWPARAPRGGSIASGSPAK
jgi:hypothetical protein